MPSPTGSSWPDLLKDFLYPSGTFNHTRVLILLAIGFPLFLILLLASFAFTKPKDFFNLVDEASKRITDVPSGYVQPDTEPDGEITIPPYPIQVSPKTSKPDYSRYTVWSFDRTDEEEARIEQVVRNLGFAFESKPPDPDQVEKIPVISDIWFGKNVDQEAVKDLAKGLVNANLTIRSIKPFSNRKRNYDPDNILQIGADGDTQMCRLWTLKDIDAADLFIRDHDGCLN
ncbi:MAG: hypothetical protein AAGD25_33830 [Cyanobacteria bacterium P01_F01_bin.150]